MILILNPGSSSLKYHLYNDDLSLVESNNIKVLPKLETKNHTLACKKIIEELGSKIDQVDSIGIRVVHGGDQFVEPTVVTNAVLNKIDQLSQLAPLHNPSAVKVIKMMKKTLKNKRIVAVFDTAFYANLPLINQTYPLPKMISEKYKIKKYGFHGISHKFVCNQLDPKKEYKVISIHLGGGCSITATDKGNVINTSMGMTPDDGLLMQTRSGDIDPGLVLYLVDKLGLKKAKSLIENQSGLAALTNTDGEMLEVLSLAGWKVEADGFEPKYEATEKSKEKAELALNMYIGRIRKYIVSYFVEMGGVDIIAFTGNVGAGSSVLRDKVMEGLGFLNYTEIESVRPNEELAIAKEVVSLNSQN